MLGHDMTFVHLHYQPAFTPRKAGVVIERVVAGRDRERRKRAGKRAICFQFSPQR